MKCLNPVCVNEVTDAVVLRNTTFGRAVYCSHRCRWWWPPSFQILCDKAGIRSSVNDLIDLIETSRRSGVKVMEFCEIYKMSDRTFNFITKRLREIEKERG